MRAAGPVITVRSPFVGRVWLTTTYAAALATGQEQPTVRAGGPARRPAPGRPRASPGGCRSRSSCSPITCCRRTSRIRRRLRRLVDAAFARQRHPGDARRHRADRRSAARPVHDGREEVDLVAEFSRDLPLEVICDLLGLPLAGAYGVLGAGAAGADDQQPCRPVSRRPRLQQDHRLRAQTGRTGPAFAATRPDWGTGPRGGSRRQVRRARAAVDGRSCCSSPASRPPATLIADSVLMLERHPDKKALVAG